ncbi:unnamed protein product [Psylliodes chrysocephalus]|uniref:Uncharacterized protein n=1 Tax=Psylliodes chrysocephalus TaxID=3402493 RepID=A0A9P0CGE3_9CUCU|nr:unnamed protein product [Psylliodes chrysocephala]
MDELPEASCSTKKDACSDSGSEEDPYATDADSDYNPEELNDSQRDLSTDDEVVPDENFKKSIKEKTFEPLKLRPVVWFRYDKEHFLNFAFKETLNAEFLFSRSEKCAEVGITRATIIGGEIKTNDTTPVQKVTFAKLNDLKQLLPFIPPIHHDFYRIIPHLEKNQLKKTASDDPDDIAHISDIIESDRE